VSLGGEEVGDGFFEGFDGERLAKEVNAFVQRESGMQVCRRVAADEEDGKAWFFFAQPESELITGEVGHDDIGDEDIDILRIVLEALDSFVTGTGLKDGMAAVEEMHVQEFAQVFIIIDQKNSPDRIRIPRKHPF
jgi:hypothetical protein